MSLCLLVPGVRMGGGSTGTVFVSGTWTEPARPVTFTERARSVTFTEANRVLTWSAPTMAILVKRAAEVRTYLMDLSALAEIVGGDTVASVTSILCTEATPANLGATSDLTLTSKAVHSTDGATVKVAGGTDGVTYKLTFTVATTAGLTLVGIGYLYVDDR